MIVSKNTIQNFIPQRAPFVMVDSIEFFDESSLVATFIPESENLFAEEELFSEPGLIEHMAQSVALHTGYSYFLKDKPAPTGYIGSIGKLEVFSTVLIGQKLQSEVKIITEFDGITLVNIETKINDTLVSTAQMKTVIAR